jgi:molecular chaperone GrpE (heat shock protein)
MSKKIKNDPQDQATEQDVLIEKLNVALELAQEKERRAVADYQNLVRRSQQERVRVAKFAALDFVETILEPLGHLSLAAAQLNDTGLNMVLGQLWASLNEAGLEEINPVGEKFTVETMEVVQVEEGDAEASNAEGVVKKVILKGYKLNGEVIRHAKVTI